MPLDVTNDGLMKSLLYVTDQANGFAYNSLNNQQASMMSRLVNDLTDKAKRVEQVVSRPPSSSVASVSSLASSPHTSSSDSKSAPDQVSSSSRGTSGGGDNKNVMMEGEKDLEEAVENLEAAIATLLHEPIFRGKMLLTVRERELNYDYNVRTFTATDIESDSAK